VLSSLAPSVRIAFSKQEWDSIEISLRNLSPHAVVAYVVSEASGPCDRTESVRQSTAAHPAIAAGASVTVSPGGNGPISVRAALFDDGSWEGDPIAIAPLRAGMAAMAALRRQINEAAARILSDPTLDDNTRIGRLRTAIDAVPEKPAPAIIRKALAGLPVPRLSDTQQKILESNLHNLKWSEAAGLNQFTPGRDLTLAQFWEITHAARSLTR